MLTLKNNELSYLLSNDTIKIPQIERKVTKQLVLIKDGLKFGDADKIQMTSQKLLNILIKELRIKTDKPIKIWTNSQRTLIKNRKRQGQKYGHFKYKLSGNSHSIIIASKTAKTNKYTTIKQFMKTLIHEIMHVYDTFVLKIKSMHTKGFYIRTSNLYNQVMN